MMYRRGGMQNHINRESEDEIKNSIQPPPPTYNPPIHHHIVTYTSFDKYRKKSVEMGCRDNNFVLFAVLRSMYVTYDLIF